MANINVRIFCLFGCLQAQIVPRPHAAHLAFFASDMYLLPSINNANKQIENYTAKIMNLMLQIKFQLFEFVAVAITHAVMLLLQQP